MVLFLSIICLVVSVCIPIFFCIEANRKLQDASLTFFFSGVLCFLVFAVVLEGLLNRIIGISSLRGIIESSVFLKMIYAGLVAALFEEGGRWFFYSRLKKGVKNDGCCILYGIGHGGIEFFVVLGITMISNLLLMYLFSDSGKLLINQIPFEKREVFRDAYLLVASSKPSMFVFSLIERFFAFIMQISLSIIVWIAVTKKKTVFVIALFLHALVNAIDKISINSRRCVEMQKVKIERNTVQETLLVHYMAEKCVLKNFLSFIQIFSQRIYVMGWIMIFRNWREEAIRFYMNSARLKQQCVSWISCGKSKSI